MQTLDLTHRRSLLQQQHPHTVFTLFLMRTPSFISSVSKIPSVRRIDQAAEIGTSKHPNWDQLAVAVGRQQLATNERLYIAVIDMSLTQQHLGKLVKPSVREANRYRCYFMVDYAKMFFSVIWVITIKLSVAKTTVQLPMSVCLCVFNSINKSRHDVH